jgi:hypothetical protein
MSRQKSNTIDGGKHESIYTCDKAAQEQQGFVSASAEQRAHNKEDVVPQGGGAAAEFLQCVYACIYERGGCVRVCDFSSGTHLHRDVPDQASNPGSEHH